MKFKEKRNSESGIDRECCQLSKADEKRRNFRLLRRFQFTLESFFFFKVSFKVQIENKKKEENYDAIRSE